MRQALAGLAMLTLGMMIGAAPHALRDACVYQAEHDVATPCLILLGLRIVP